MARQLFFQRAPSAADGTGFWNVYAMADGVPVNGGTLDGGAVNALIVVPLFETIGDLRLAASHAVHTSADVVARLHAAFPLEPLQASAPGETAQRWRYADGGGEVGFISSVTQAFCRDCIRARRSTEGKLYLCLFASQGHDLRHLLRKFHVEGCRQVCQRGADLVAGFRGVEAKLRLGMDRAAQRDNARRQRLGRRDQSGPQIGFSVLVRPVFHP